MLSLSAVDSGRHDVGDLVGAVEVIVLLRVVRLGHQAAHLLLDLRVGGRVAGQVNDIVAQVQLAGIDGTGVLAEVLVQQVRIRLPRGVQKRLAVVLRAADDRHLADLILLESIFSILMAKLMRSDALRFVSI